MLEINKHTAVMMSMAISIFFVASIYALPSKIRELPRNDPLHIMFRFLAISVVCVLCTFLLALLFNWENGNLELFLSILGFNLKLIRLSILNPLILTALLFLGPLVERHCEFWHSINHTPVSRMVYSPRAKHVPAFSAWLSMITTWSPLDTYYISCRNFIFAPIVEEYVFRSCMIPLFVSAGFSLKWTVIGCPLLFGIAHIHHVIDGIRKGRPMQTLFLQTTFQFTYTTIFGMFAVYVFLITGQILSIVSLHVFCNLMGVPDFKCFAMGRPLAPFSDSKIRFGCIVAYVLGIYMFVKLFAFFLDSSSYRSILWEIMSQ